MKRVYALTLREIVDKIIILSPHCLAAHSGRRGSLGADRLLAHRSVLRVWLCVCVFPSSLIRPICSC